MCHIKSAQPSAPSLIGCLKQNSLLRDVVLKGKKGGIKEGALISFQACSISFAFPVKEEGPS